MTDQEKLQNNINCIELYADNVSKYLDELFANENLLDRFLFGTDSFVETGNDNSDGYPDEDNYDHNIYDTIEKGN